MNCHRQHSALHFLEVSNIFRLEFEEYFRANSISVTYQLGNMVSSPSAQIVNAIAESHLITVDGERVSAYGPTMGVATAIIAIGIMVTAALGPEKRGSHFESIVIGMNTEAAEAQVKADDLERGSVEKPAEREKVEVTDHKEET